MKKSFLTDDIIERLSDISSISGSPTQITFEKPFDDIGRWVFFDQRFLQSRDDTQGNVAV
jgi:hypothetical protein